MQSRAVGRTIIVAATILVLRTALAFAQTTGEPIRVVGATIDPNTGRTGHIEIDITRWSTNAETKRLLAVLGEQGQEKFLSALQKNLRVGSFHMAGQLGHDLRYVSESQLPDGGKAILLVTDRWMSFAELRNRPRSVNYPFICIQLQLNGDGEGEGTMSPAAKLISGGGLNVVAENYGNYDVMQPVRLASLKAQKLKR